MGTVYSAAIIVREGPHGYTATVNPALVLAAFVGAALLVLAIFLAGKGGRPLGEGGRKSEAVHAAREGLSPGEGVRPGACPLCSSALAPGERIKSDIYPGKGDRLMRIFGCPRCLAPDAPAPRTCPVCGSGLGRESWALARYFEKPGRRHVHILGCPACRPALGTPGSRDSARFEKE